MRRWLSRLLAFQPATIRSNQKDRRPHIAGGDLFAVKWHPISFKFSNLLINTVSFR
jgi:hypothetical protein